MRKEAGRLEQSSGDVAVPQRVRGAYVDRVSERLSDRDWAIMEMVNRLRFMSGNQVERLFFSNLSGRSKTVKRGQVLHRLVDWKVLASPSRLIGGGLRGSSASLFALGDAGRPLLVQRQLEAGIEPRVRHPGVPAERTRKHILAVSELLVSLIEQAWSTGMHVATFDAEPACWWPNGLGGYLKPDAYLVVQHGQVRDHWWAELDMATESLPALKRQFLAYLDFVERGQLGPGDVVPRVLVVVTTKQRYDAVHLLLSRLPKPADQLFGIATDDRASEYILQVLRA